MSSAVDDVTQRGGELPVLHLSGHLTPDAGHTEGGAQTVTAQTALNTQETSTHNYCSKSTTIQYYNAVQRLHYT